MAAVMAAGLIRRARIVIAVDLDADRLALAKELGATHTVLGGTGDVVAQIKEICGGSEHWRGVDYAVDCTGVPAVVRTMIDSLGMRGRAATVGAPGPGKEVRVDVMGMLTYGKEYVGCSEGDSNPSEVSPTCVGGCWGLMLTCWSRAVYPLFDADACRGQVSVGEVDRVL